MMQTVFAFPESGLRRHLLDGDGVPIASFLPACVVHPEEVCGLLTEVVLPPIRLATAGEAAREAVRAFEMSRSKFGPLVLTVSVDDEVVCSVNRSRGEVSFYQFGSTAATTMLDALVSEAYGADGEHEGAAPSTSTDDWIDAREREPIPAWRRLSDRLYFCPAAGFFAENPLETNPNGPCAGGSLCVRHEDKAAVVGGMLRRRAASSEGQTLILCPPHLVGMWARRMAAELGGPGGVRVLDEWKAPPGAHGATTTPRVLISSYDRLAKDRLKITSTNIGRLHRIRKEAAECAVPEMRKIENEIRAEKARIAAHCVFGVAFARVILDESNCLRENTAKLDMTTHIKSTVRWLINSLPIENEQLSFKLLRAHPLGNKYAVRATTDTYRALFSRVSRRIEPSRREDPKKRVVHIQLNPRQLSTYESFGEHGADFQHTKRRRVIDQLVSESTRVSLSSTSLEDMPPPKDKLLSVFGSVRECESIDEFVGDLPAEGALKDVCDVLEGKPPNCPICMSEVSRPVMTMCGHVFCRSCMEQLIHSTRFRIRTCPSCRAELEGTVLAQIVAPTAAAGAAAGAAAASRDDAICKEAVDELAAAGPDAKVVIISKFEDVLRLVCFKLDEKGIPCRSVTPRDDVDALLRQPGRAALLLKKPASLPCMDLSAAAAAIFAEPSADPGAYRYVNMPASVVHVVAGDTVESELVESEFVESEIVAI
jgi:hypothetical protein